MASHPIGSAFPTSEQELLLRAALLTGSPALDAWKQWRSRVDFDNIDLGSQRLLPLLYTNLHALDVDDTLMGRLKGHYRLTWYKNQTLFHEIEATLCALHEAGIRTMLLKGAALSILHYRDRGLRPMSDFDIVVPEADVPQALHVLGAQGWRDSRRTGNASLEAVLAAYHSATFVRGDSDLDLHSRVGFAFWRHDLPDVWNDAVPVALNGVETLALSPADTLIHVCVHGLAWNQVPPLRWIADTVMLLRAEPMLDWAHVVARAREAHLTLPLYTALRYIDNLLDLDIPTSALHELESTPVSPVERARLRFALRPRSVGSRLLRHYDKYTNLRSRQQAPGFLRYLQQTWGDEHLWQTPLRGVKHISRHLLRL